MDGGIDTLSALLATLQERLAALDLMEVLQDPYFIAFSCLFCVVTVARRMVNTLVLYVAGIGLAVLFHYTVPGGDVTTIESKSLLTFAGGGVVICAALVYFLLIRSE